MKLKKLFSHSDTEETCSEIPEETNVSTCLRTTKELRDSLVDMYSANPRVNVELQQRLPSPARQQLNTTQQSSNSDRSGTSLDHNERPQHVQETSSAFSLLSHKRSFSPLSSKPSGRTGHMEVALSPSRGLSLCADNCGDHYEGNGGSRGPGSPTLRRPTITADNSFLQETNISRPQSLDQDKNILFLLKELDVLRQHNKKLQEQLVQKEKELQRREIEEELKEELKEAQSWEKPAVLNEVLAAQKDRDQALMSRILLANEERDEAVLRARRLQQTDTEDMDLEETDLEVHQLLRRVCDSDSVQEVHQFGSVLVQHLRLAQQRRDDITAQEMKAIMAERDGCMLRCKRLEQDLIQEREQRATKEELLRLQREGDGALDDRQRLGAELQAHQTSHGLHLWKNSCRRPSPFRPHPSWSSCSSCQGRSRAWRWSFNAVWRRSVRPARESADWSVWSRYLGRRSGQEVSVLSSNLQPLMKSDSSSSSSSSSLSIELSGVCSFCVFIMTIKVFFVVVDIKLNKVDCSSCEAELKLYACRNETFTDRWNLNDCDDK
ncbi:mirror-image polydactyly gene 1 protein isoform X2 [Echeneis naucrates]|uniref:mirror-image polydactyly gene 1 protein isoform X2 n=1 Tax=Echeneis naucrates TaxID=173247 RepID=UPI00111358D9|nr:mirror-image polydactyly gene 1 protein isoform X2 [Echeneis naucrates]